MLLVKLLEFYMMIFWMLMKKEATPMMIITIVLAAAILTGLGLYDCLGKKAGAGNIYPNYWVLVKQYDFKCIRS